MFAFNNPEEFAEVKERRSWKTQGKNPWGLASSLKYYETRVSKTICRILVVLFPFDKKISP
jgi:hypothetical protein